jgi:hypothetical protein
VKDDAKGVTLSATNMTHTMPKVNAILTPRSFDWAVMDGEYHRVALS